MSEKKPKSLTPSYEASGAIQLDNLNAWIKANKPNYEPKYTSFNEYKQANHLAADKAYQRLRRAADWFIRGEK